MKQKIKFSNGLTNNHFSDSVISNNTRNLFNNHISIFKTKKKLYFY